MSKYTFVDLEGKVWDLKITLGKARLIEEAQDNGDYEAVTKVDFVFLQPTQEFFSEVFSNVQFAMALAWTLVQDQVPNNYEIPLAKLQEASTQAEVELRFVNAMDGNILQKARQVLMESLADFFPEQRTVLLTLQNKIEKVRKMMELELENAGPQLDQMIEKEIKAGTVKALEKLNGQNSTKPLEFSDTIHQKLKP